ncbi:MAG: hypothetical protein IJW47_01360 [Clostridia bacterium]|nr:hypothetical protein [Clostridia bacterium]
MKEKQTKHTDTVNDNLKTALLKKALGYKVTETVEEYVESDEGEIKLLKKKVTKKNVPPDVTALKILLDETAKKPLTEMTDEELEIEKQRLLNELQKSVKKTKEN